MTELPVSTEELEAVVVQYRHLQSEHRRAGVGGSTRRRLHARLLALEKRFDELVTEWVPTELERNRWRDHLHHGSPQPAEIRGPQLPVAFKGCSEAGSIVEVLELPEGGYAVLIDEAEQRRIRARLNLHKDTRGCRLELDGFEFRETFDASPAALRALRGYVESPAGKPPWEHADELVRDGLIDRHFSLTPRGRRAV